MLATKNLDKLREVWVEALGFEPRIMATFDHISAGWDSRILVGYEGMRQTWRRIKKNEGLKFDLSDSDAVEPVVSLVIDTVLPQRELYGVSAEVGFLDSRRCQAVLEPDVFYFRNEFNFPFLEEMPDFVRMAEATVGNRPRAERSVSFRDHDLRRIIGGYDLVRRAFKDAQSTIDVLEARRTIMKMVNRGSFRHRTDLWSEALPTVAEVLERASEQGLKLEDCPGVDKTGLARLVNEDGTEGDVLSSWGSELAELIAKQKAVPTAPLCILASSLLWPHFGNDYGLLSSIGAWSGIEPRVVAGDGKNGWPAGIIRFNRGSGETADLHNVFTDLMHFLAPEYRELIGQAVEKVGPAFDVRAGHIE